MATRNNQPHDVPHASSYTAVRNHSVNVSSSTQVPPQLAAGASHSNCSSHTHAPHATENLFSIDQLFYGTHSRMTYNHSRIVNHFAMLSRTTTNHINLPQQKTFTYHSPLPFLNLHSRNYFLTTSRWRPPRSGFFPVGESLNIINSNSTTLTASLALAFTVELSLLSVEEQENRGQGWYMQ